MKRVLTLFSNSKESSVKAEALLRKTLENSEFEISNKLEEETELIICIGGDGTFLEGIHFFNFPSVPFLGINTGHLGFFQEIRPEQITAFFESYGNGTYSIQEMTTLEATLVNKKGENVVIKGLNEIVVRNTKISKPIHLALSIDDTFMENFSGDGIVVSSSAGSTAYNYSLGGSILEPSLKAIQVTPISPMNNKAYRSFTSSILLSAERCIKVKVDCDDLEHNGIKLSTDNREFEYKDIDVIKLKISNDKLKLVRLEDYNFWKKIKDKFL